MSVKEAEFANTNGFESKTPFLIGVAGGTASGKVSADFDTKVIDFLQYRLWLRNSMILAE